MTLQNDDEQFDDRLYSLQKRIDFAIGFLGNMIDGGEECRGRDSEISQVIRILEGEKL